MSAHGRMADLTEYELRQIEGKWKSQIEKKVDGIDSRMRVVERLIWIGIGGLIVVAGLVTMIGTRILELLKI